MSNIFEPRRAYKPFEYPQIMQFINAMNQSFWVHSEVDFTADIQDFHSNLQTHEQEAIKRALLAIAQIEVSVKTFWGNLYNILPKPEFNGLGSTFAECEFRHSEAYSRLLEVLGYTNDFDKVIDVPAIATRIQHLKNIQIDVPELTYAQNKALSILLFSILIENVSLFSQFATILSFTRFKGYMKNVANMIAWTSIDEQVHANGGIAIVNIIKEENPGIFDSPVIKRMIKNIIENSIAVEGDIIHWIFETGAIDHVDKASLLAYMKRRLNDSLDALNLQEFKYSDEDTMLSKNLNWFEEDVFANALDDFFAKRPVEYTKHDKSITANDLF